MIWICNSRERESKNTLGRGIPIGNLTSQLFANIYLHEFDKFIKHKLKVKYYIRFADDFVILSNNRKYLKSMLSTIQSYLAQRLKLQTHSKKLLIKTMASGMDFLGWVHFPDHRVLRATTKRRMLNRLRVNKSDKTINSYLGLIKHGNTNKLKKKVFDLINKNP